jgi:hypothetical protein
MSSVDKELRELALRDWDQFKRITGIDTLRFTICTKRKQGKSLTHIALSTNVSRSKVQRVCKVCP